MQIADSDSPIYDAIRASLQSLPLRAAVNESTKQENAKTSPVSKIGKSMRVMFASIALARPVGWWSKLRLASLKLPSATGSRQPDNPMR